MKKFKRTHLSIDTYEKRVKKHLPLLKQNAQELLLDDSDPGQIIGRQEQRDQLNNYIFDQLNKDASGVSTVYIYGGSGTGKTFTVNKKVEQYVQENDVSNTSTQYINARRYSTYYQVLVKIADNLKQYLPVRTEDGMLKKMPTSGHSASEVQDAIINIVREKDLTLLITIDEIDKIDSEDSGELIAFFSDLNDAGHDIHLISISNDPYLLEQYAENVNRRISQKIHFPKYDAGDLKQILRVFAGEALQEGTYNEESLANVAKEAAHTSGSASQAKKLLYHVAEESVESLNPDNIKQAQGEVDKKMVKEEIQTQPPHHTAALRAVVECWQQYQYTRENGDGDPRKNAPTTSNVYKRYCEVCAEYGLNEKTKRSLINFLNSLENNDLISSQMQGFGRARGVSKLHEPLYDCEILKTMTDETLEEVFV